MTFQILCLSGGGFLGLYTAEVLAKLEADTGPIAQRFDLIAGTSIGGIIALGLAAGRPASEIRDAIVSKGQAIFGAKGPPQTWLGQRLALRKGAFRARYSPGPLRDAIEEIVGAATLIGDLKSRVIVPAVNLSKGKPQVFKTPHHTTFLMDQKLRVVDVALATSAAPTYFPIHRINGELFCDGGLYANAPDLLALHEAQHFLGVSLDDIRMLSIGTTSSSFSFSNAGGTDLGWLGWLSGARLTSVMIAAQQLDAGYIVGHRLKDRYLRIDHDQSKEQERQLGLDVASAAAKLDLAALAQSSVRRFIPDQLLQSILRNTAPAPTFPGKRS